MHTEARAQKLHAMPRQKDGTFMEPLARDNSRQYFEGARYIERDTRTCVHTSRRIEYNLGITSSAASRRAPIPRRVSEENTATLRCFDAI